jgi:hypothetical protein
MREKPKLYLDALIGRRIKVRAGEPINILIPITGAPTPKIEWTKDLLRVPETLRISVGKTILYKYKKNIFFALLSKHNNKYIFTRIFV